MKKSTLWSENDLWACLFLMFATATILYPVIFTGEGSFFIKQDNLHQAYPFYNKLAIALHKGYIPVWDANTYGGKNFAGELQAGIFYPVNIVWCLLFGSIHGIDTWHLDLLIALHYLICALGMYRLARVFSLPAVSSVAAALVFAFSGAIGARAAGQTCIFCGLTLIPWSVSFVAYYYLVRRRKLYFILAGLIAGLEILAGHMQPFFHTVLIEGIIVIYYEYAGMNERKTFFLNSILAVFIIVVTAFIVALPQLYYSSQYLSRAYRTVSNGYFIAPGEKVPLFVYGHWFILKLENLFNFFVHDYAQPDDDNAVYMGFLPIALLVAALVTTSKIYADLKKLTSGILLLGFLSALGFVTFFYLVLYEIPFVNQVRQLGRYIILISFGGSLLAGLAITQIGEWSAGFWAKYRTQKMFVLVLLCLNFVYLAFFQQKYVPLAVSIPFLITTMFFLAPQFVKHSYLPAAAVVVIFIDLVLNPVSYEGARTRFYPDYFYGRNRIIDTLEKTYGKYRTTFDMQDYSLVRRNLGAIYKIQTKWGYGATVNKNYADFTHMDRVADPNADDLLNVRYVLADRALDTSFIFRDSVNGLKLFERKTWYPRCYWRQQLGRQGKDIEAENGATIREGAYSDSYQRWDVSCSISDTLIFSENYYPGWHCYDNGKELPILPVKIRNHPALFRGVLLNEGEHHLEFKYNKVFYWF